MRVIVAEDVMLTREGIVRLLELAGVEVVAQVGDASALLLALTRSTPDAVVVDIRMPPTNTDEGLVAAARVREAYPGVGVVVLSAYLEPGWAIRLLEENPEGIAYLLKDRVVDIAVLVDAIRRVCDGETVVDPTIVRRLVDRRRQPDPLASLTDREHEVLELVGEGLTNRAIATRLVVSERTVEFHMTQVFGKLGLDESPEQHRRVAAVLTLLRS
jgi:DNA-binding NarL/FixJ family response regulator